VYANPLEAAATGRAARQHILQHFTPDALASLVLAEIVRIQEKLGPDRTVPTAEERAARQQSHSLCLMYPHLCRQGMPEVHTLAVISASARDPSPHTM